VTLRQPVLLVIATLLVGACGTNAESAVPPAPDASAPAVVPPGVDAALVARACQFGRIVFDVGPVALCAKAVALAIARLGGPHAPITSASSPAAARYRTRMTPSAP
jgi:hypothetical protein